MWLLGDSGTTGRQITDITWALLILSIVVVAVIAALVLVALRRGRGSADRAAYRIALAPTRDGPALKVIYAGLAATIAILVGFVVWTVETLAAMEMPPAEPAVTVDVVGRQFWWELHYRGADGDFVTANEIHVPVGAPVRFNLASADVIHSFWVPALGGKTDMIPGQANTTWLEATKAGTFLGQCAEYCGLQHAHMAFRVIAEPAADFADWARAEAQPARAPVAEAAVAGQRAFAEHCGKCHTVRGITTSTKPGPDLTHLMRRSTLAAGMLPNRPGDLAGWITNPEALKPGTTMPTVPLSADELHAVLAFLATLE